MFRCSLPSLFNIPFFDVLSFYLSVLYISIIHDLSWLNLTSIKTRSRFDLMQKISLEAISEFRSSIQRRLMQQGKNWTLCTRKQGGIRRRRRWLVTDYLSMARNLNYDEQTYQELYFMHLDLEYHYISISF